MTLAIGPWDTEGDAYHRMSRLVFSYWACWTVCAVADLSIADHLADGALTAAEVAEREHTSSDTILRLMQAAAAVGLLTQRDGRFKSTPLLQTLRSDDPRSLRPMVLCLMGNWLPWTDFIDGIRQGKTPSTKKFGGSMFDYLASHPDEAELFTDAMASGTGVWGPAIADAIDTTGVQCAVDVGGGNGSLLAHLQRNNPSLRGVVYDRPNVIESAYAAVKRGDLTERTSVVGGSFFEFVPHGDLIILKFILHDWPDEQCVTILQRCRDALAPGGRIAVIEMLVSEANPLAALCDMNMFLMSPGRERSLTEFDALFEAVGLKRTSVHQTRTPQSVIEIALA